jgi:hypothetical protein
VFTLLCVLLIICAVIVLASFRKQTKKVVLPTYVPESQDGSVPRPESRRWARAQYFSGNIGMEELVRFCAEHEERLDDPDR